MIQKTIGEVGTLGFLNVDRFLRVSKGITLSRSKGESVSKTVLVEPFSTVVGV
jgi:hypothetical protein